MCYNKSNHFDFKTDKIICHKKLFLMPKYWSTKVFSEVIILFIIKRLYWWDCCKV